MIKNCKYDWRKCPEPERKTWALCWYCGSLGRKPLKEAQK